MLLKNMTKLILMIMEKVKKNKHRLPFKKCTIYTLIYNKKLCILYFNVFKDADYFSKNYKMQ